MPGKANFRILALLVALFSSVIFLPGCNTTSLTAASLMDLNPLEFFSSPVNMQEKNYATADYLVDRARNYMKPGDKIKAMPLLDIQEPRLVTKLGKQIPEQIGERLTQLGYNVDLSAVSTDVNPSFAAAPQPVTNNPDFILSGSYIRNTSVLDIRIHIKDARTGFDRAVFNYPLKRTGAIRSISTPEPMIYRAPN